jgi:hypothetical protein
VKRGDSTSGKGTSTSASRVSEWKKMSEQKNMQNGCNNIKTFPPRGFEAIVPSRVIEKEC